MKSLQQHITEKLFINKNYNINEDILISIDKIWNNSLFDYLKFTNNSFKQKTFTGTINNDKKYVITQLFLVLIKSIYKDYSSYNEDKNKILKNIDNLCNKDKKLNINGSKGKHLLWSSGKKCSKKEIQIMKDFYLSFHKIKPDKFIEFNNICEDNNIVFGIYLQKKYIVLTISDINNTDLFGVCIIKS